MSKELFRERVLLRDYVLTAEDEETIKKWKAEIDEILAAIGAGKIDKMELENLLRGNREYNLSHIQRGEFVRDLEPLFKMLEAGTLDEESKKLLAIGLWVKREKGEWGSVSSSLKAGLGGEYPLSSVLSKPTCIDTAVLSKEMAKQFGVEGSVISDDRRGHRYLRTGSGKILDVWLEYSKPGGLYQDQGTYDDDYLEYMNRRTTRKAPVLKEND